MHIYSLTLPMRDIYQEFLSKTGLKESAEDSLAEFLGVEDFDELKLNTGNTQRIIMVAAKFRKEITSTVLWLTNFRLRIQCFKVTPYQAGEERYVHFEQIIPVKDIEEYMISMADKARSDLAVQDEEKTRYKLRQDFWRQLIDKANQSFDLYQNVSPSKDNWIAGASGITATTLNCVISRSYARVEVYISRSSKDENKFIFDELAKMRDDIESSFGDGLEWQRLDDKKACRIKCELTGVSYFNDEDWPEMMDFMVESMGKLIEAFRKPLKEVRAKLLKQLKKDSD